MTKSILSLALIASLGFSAVAQNPQKPEIRHVVQFEGGGHVMNVSDNGLWGVGYTFGDNGTYYCPRLVNVLTGQVIDLFESHESGIVARANDVTNDGRFVAGTWESAPAIRYMDYERWRALPYPSKPYEDVYAIAITPDGKYAVGAGWGYAISDGMTTFFEDGFFWDLTGNIPELVDLPNLPNVDNDGNSDISMRFTTISPDGRYIIGTVNWIYPESSYSFIYDVEKKSWQRLHGSSDAYFSPNGKLLAMEAGSGINVMNMETGEVTSYPALSNSLLGGIDNYGTIYAANSDGGSTPIRNWSFYTSGYWFSWSDALKQLFNIDWKADVTKDDLALSGTFVGVSDDALRLMAADYSGTPGGTYLITMPKPLHEYGEVLDPLSNYAFYPLAMSSFSTLRTVNVYFDRDVEVVGDTRSVKLLNSKGEEEKTSMSAALIAGETRAVTITFRNATLAAGETYTVVIPEGLVQVQGDAKRKNKEMRVQYVGRPDEPVKPIKIAPESGTAMPRLSMSTNPVTIQFDAVLSSLDGGKIGLYRVNDDEDEYLYSLSANIDNSTMTVFPAVEQELAKNVTYKVVIEPNTVGDIAGNNGNEKIEITYIGTYEPPISEGKVYEQDFNYGLSGMMLYDGDQNTPVTEVAGWGFTSEYPWWYVRDDEETMEQSAASHSMYNPAGASDDWMVTPRLWIPDATCKLTFDSQSYIKSKEDYLKVYILATSDIYTAPINKAFIDRFKKEGVLVYNEKQDPGASQEKLEGDWRHNSIDLSEYDGKYIYIAFVNQNENQSAIFLDNIVVDRDLAFNIANTTPDYIVDAASTPVSLVVKANEGHSYDAATFRLLDANGNLIVEDTPADVKINAESTYNYTFSKELSLNKGMSNEYTVEALIGDKTVVLPSSIKNLRFKPERTIVIEEGTGTKCGYCPLGHRTLEYMNEIFGDKIIPVAVHGYPSGSTFGNAWAQEYCNFFGFLGYPSGSLNREVSCSPMYSDGTNYLFNSPTGDATWCDFASKMLAELTDADLAIDHVTIDPDSRQIEVGVKMNYAYDNDNANLNLHTVVLENKLVSQQTNNLSNYTGPNLGDWGHGGKYGSDEAFYVFNHVARGMNATSFAGVSGVFPRVIDSSKDYNRTYSFAMPSEISKPENTEVVVMLIDANTNRVINAAKAPCLVGVVGLDGINVDNDINRRGDVYSITGVKVLNNATIEDVNRLEKGIYIFNGRKVMVR